MRVTNGWDSYYQSTTGAPPPPPPRDRLSATPLSSRDLSSIPPRKWIYGRELIRGFVSVLASPGGVGKTAYTMAVGVSVATGRALLSPPGVKPAPHCTIHKPGRVWFFNLEDPMDELDRRMKATLDHHDVPFADVADNIFIDSGRETPLVVARRDGNELLVAPVVDDLVEEIKALQISVVVIDPFLRSHEATENKNEEMDFVMSLWGQVAHDADCAVWLVHHFRKGGQSGDPESVRGAVAIHGGARSMYTIGNMAPEDADKFGVPVDDRKLYIRHDNAKQNMAPSAAVATWYRLVGINLNNGDDEYPLGDSVQTVEAWSPPSKWEGVSWAAIEDILNSLDRGTDDGEFYALGKQAKDRWAGHVVMLVTGKSEAQAISLLKAWKDNGVIEDGVYRSRKYQKETKCVRVNQAKFSEMRQAGVLDAFS